MVTLSNAVDLVQVIIHEGYSSQGSTVRTNMIVTQVRVYAKILKVIYVEKSVSRQILDE